MLDKAFMQSSAQAAANNFIENISLVGNEIIAFYYPINNELDCLPLLEKLRVKNHEICFPVTKNKNCSMIFRLWQLGEELIDGEFDIKTPNDNALILQPDIIIIPLVAYDKKGNRLGYGKGYYDRTIAQMDKKPLLVGYAYAMQQVEHIEHESHDVPLDYIVNEKQVRRF